MKSAISDADTKYPAELTDSAMILPCCCRYSYFGTLRLKMPIRHLFSALKTPDPEAPTRSRMRVLNLHRRLGAINSGDMIWVYAVLSVSITTTFSPTCGGCLHKGFRRNCRLAGSRISSIERSVTSVCSEPSLTILAGRY